MALFFAQQLHNVLVDGDELAVKRRLLLNNRKRCQAHERVKLVHGVAEGLRTHCGKYHVVECLVHSSQQVVVVLCDCLAGFSVEFFETVYVQLLAPKESRRLDCGACTIRIGNKVWGRGSEEHATVRNALTKTF